MNISDIISGMKSSSGNEFAKKMQIKSEEKNIEKRINNLIEDVIRFISEEAKYISNSLSYGYNPNVNFTLSEEEMKHLFEKLKSESKSIPSKIEAELKDIFEDIFEDAEEAKKEVEEPEVKQIEVTVTPVSTSSATTEQPSIQTAFGY